MQQVYAVWFDNGMSYEDNDVSLIKLFSSQEDAKAFVEEKKINMSTFVPSMTKEQYYAQDDVTCSYDVWLEHEEHMWGYFNSGHYFISTEELF
jgi:hypothetical protein